MLEFLHGVNCPSNMVPISFSLDNIEYMSFMGICSNPHCPCRDVRFYIDKKFESNQISKSNSLYHFYVDLFKRKYSKINITENTSWQSRKLAKKFIKNLTKDDWEKLGDEFFNFKYRLVDNFNPEHSEFEFHFPWQAVEEEHFMIGYREIFPFARDETIEDEKFRYLIDDQYCLDPKCSCRSAAITFMPFKKNGPPLSPRNHISIRYAYQKNTYEKIFNVPDKFDLKKLVSLLLNSISGYPDILRIRHEKLKRLYGKCRPKINKQISMAANSKNEKVGRNDPCPCGSGKKYKHCCGR